MAEVDFGTAFLLALVEATPSTITVIVGFFIFHILASRRQKRDELFGAVRDVQGLIEKAIEEIRNAWAIPGKEAEESGAVLKIRLLMTRISFEFAQLCEQEQEFEDAKKALQEFRRTIDEFEDPVSGESLHISDQSRASYKRAMHPALIAARKFSDALLTSHWNRHKPG